MADIKEEGDQQPNPMPAITGDFSNWSQQQLVEYFRSLNEQANPHYQQEELHALPLNQLKAWATKAYQIVRALKMQGKMPQDQQWIPAEQGKIPIPKDGEIEQILKEREDLTVMQALMVKHKKQEDEEKKHVEHDDVNIQVNHGKGNVENGQGDKQQRKQGIKRKFENEFLPMPEDEKFEAVDVMEAARFFNGGFATIKPDVEH